MLLGIIADDFTGASDIGNTLAKGQPGEGGLKTTLFLGVPDKAAPAACEAGIVALKSRSIPATEAVAQSLAALAWLREQGCRQFLFKYCSTFDSTPDGNIGPVGEALADALGVKGVVACPAFPTLGRTIYQGHLFVFDRLLNESGLEQHPLNPMTDADIRRWLRLQSRAPVGHVAWSIVRQGPEPVRQALQEAVTRGETLVIVDAIDDSDLLAIGRACADAPLLTGGSGIALGLPRNFIERGLATGQSTAFAGVAGPAAILAGSCSRATRGQVEQHSRSHPAFSVDIDALMGGAIGVTDLVAFAQNRAGQAPLLYSSQPPEAVAALQERHGRDRIAHALDHVFAETARTLTAGGVRRLVVAGGETAGAVVSTLGLGALTIGPEIEPGVPVLIAEDPPLALALKSGNFGSPDFFGRAINALGGEQ